ncbi:MAG: exodeoxyribonuclease VII large subunit, partial [Thermodesulfobacteriota bacterium]
VDPNYTLGEMEAKLKAIRNRLIQEGIYNNNKQLTPPRDFTTILLITPEQAAGLGDFMQNMEFLQQSGLIRVNAETAVFESPDTGRQISSIIDSYSGYANSFDAIFIIRGGGPRTSLAWLNDYEIAESVCSAPVPVFTGVGHERDHTIIDEVAHMALGTPSKAAGHIEQTIFRQAETALQNWEYIRQYVNGIIRNTGKECEHAITYILDAARYFVQVSENSCDQLRQSVRDNAGYINKGTSEECDNILQFLADNGKSRIRTAGNGINELLYANVAKDSKSLLVQMKRDIEGLISEIASSGPHATLQRGFALTRSKQGRIVSSRETALRERELEVEYWDGKVNTIVEQKNSEDKGV